MTKEIRQLAYINFAWVILWIGVMIGNIGSISEAKTFTWVLPFEGIIFFAPSLVLAIAILDEKEGRYE